MALDHTDDEPLRPPGSASTENSEGVAAGERGALREIFTVMVQFLRTSSGAGPTKVRTNYAGRDVF